MAEWLRHSFAKWKVPGLNLTMGKVFEKFWLKSLKKRPAILCLHDGSPDDGSAPQLIKRLGVCYHVYMISAHKEHVWTIRTCPTTILLSAVTMCECVCEWQQ